MAAPKKTTAKTAEPKAVEEVAPSVVETVEEPTVKEEAQTAEEIMDSVDTEIHVENKETLEVTEKIAEAVKPVEELVAEAKEISSGKEKIEKILESKPEEAEKVIKEELKKVNEVVSKAKELIKKADDVAPVRRTISTHLNNTWNGQNYDL